MYYTLLARLLMTKEVWPRNLRVVSTKTPFTLRGLGLHISPPISISCQLTIVNHLLEPRNPTIRTTPKRKIDPDPTRCLIMC